MSKVEELELIDEDVVSVEERNLIVFNDDVNTFDHVIDTLIKVCGHTPEQAEQCTWMIHYKGKYAVKHGSFERLCKLQLGGRRRGGCKDSGRGSSSRPPVPSGCANCFGNYSWKRHWKLCKSIDIADGVR